MELLRSWGLEERALAGAMDVEWRASRRRPWPTPPPGTPVEVGFPTRAQSGVVSPTGAGVHPAGRARARDGGAPRLAARGAARARRRGVGVDSRDAASRSPSATASGIRTLRARYLIAADGIRSTVRAALGSPPTGPGHVGDQPRHPLPRAAVGRRRRAPARHLLRRRGRQEGRAPGRPARPLDVRARATPRRRTSPARSAQVAGVPGLEPEIENVAPSTTRSSSPSASASAARSWSATPPTGSARAGRRG